MSLAVCCLLSAVCCLQPYRQSERFSIYQKYGDELIANGHCYRCFCTEAQLEEKRKSQEASGAVLPLLFVDTALQCA